MDTTKCTPGGIEGGAGITTKRYVSRGMRVRCWTCGGTGMRDEAYPKVVGCERCGGKGARLLINHCPDHSFPDRRAT